MKFLSVRDLRGNSARVWRELPLEKEMIVTNNGKPVALLTAVNESNVEESLTAWRQARALQLISDIQTESVRRGVSGLTSAGNASKIAASRPTRAQKKDILNTTPPDLRPEIPYFFPFNVNR